MIYTIELLMSHSPTVEVEADSAQEATEKATYMCNNQDRYCKDYSFVISSEIISTKALEAE